MRYYSRRQFVATTGVVGAAVLAGCAGGDGGDETTAPDEGGGDQTTESGDDGGGENVVVAGPNGELVFEPEQITVSTSDAVTWEFESANHNVCAYPEMNERVSIPEGTDGFGSMPADGDRFETVEVGGTYEHTFETTGEFTYICVPHAASDMVGTVVVE